MEILKLVLPLITFLLGVIVTLVVKRWDYSRADIQKNIDEICNLSEQWFNELVNLSILGKVEKNSRILDERILTYNNASLFLTKYIKAIERLKKYDRFDNFVYEAESFYKLISSSYISNNSYIKSAVHCHSALFARTLDQEMHSRLLLSNTRGIKNNLNPNGAKLLRQSKIVELDLSNALVLHDLKQKVQKIHLEAADINI